MKKLIIIPTIIVLLSVFFLSNYSIVQKDKLASIENPIQSITSSIKSPIEKDFSPSNKQKSSEKFDNNTTNKKLELETDSDNKSIKITPEHLKQLAEFDEKNSHLQKYFYQIKDFDKAFQNDLYDADWAIKSSQQINEALFDEHGNIRFSKFDKHEIECRSTLCKVSFYDVNENDNEQNSQEAKVVRALLQMGTNELGMGGPVLRTVRERDTIVFYLSRTIDTLVDNNL